MSLLPADYTERVYAGVLGKLIGVYLGRPFEGWTYQRVMQELGHVKYYVHDKLNQPLVVIDDDISGTFTFVRALEEHGPDLTSEDIGRTWLNNVIEKRTIFWWGGKGISTEHTAYLNLKHGIPAPRSGALETNGRTVAEQIGAQIFIDGWALVSPNNPTLAAKLAREAGSVSHDGESVYAAMLWAAMEAEAFGSKDPDHLLDTGLQHTPADCLMAKLISDIRGWVKQDGDWLKTRQRIEDVYGYDKCCGTCHVVPNHGIMIMTLLYAKTFHEAMHIVNTCGWDTDCNSGNIGCLFGLMYGLDGFDGGPDWRGPIADRALISSADGGYSINDAVRITYDVVNMGRRLAGQAPITRPAQFDFSLPGSVQGFSSRAKIEQDAKGLKVHVDGEVDVMTPTYIPTEMAEMRTYDFVGSPLVYSGQHVKAVVHGDELKAQLKTDASHGPMVACDGRQVLEWILPDQHPISQLGVRFIGNGTAWLESVSWNGAPRLTILPKTRGWVDAASTFKSMGDLLYVGQDEGEGLATIGTRDWHDYKVRVSDLAVNIGGAGVAVRVQGLRRWYALVFKKGRLVLTKALDEKRIELASKDFDWKLDERYQVEVTVEGSRITARVGDLTLQGEDDQYRGGGTGLLAMDGSLSIRRIEVC